MATESVLADRLRFEIADVGKSFVYQTTATGATNRFLVPYAPVDGLSITVFVNNVNVSSTATVEELTGYVTVATTPLANYSVIIAGNYFRYFTNSEINNFIDTAFTQHVSGHADMLGRTQSLAALPGVEEYPVVVWASTLALYTLATDASFDIDITAPDGVMIPRSERYRQLMNMIESRKEQYKELCNQLGIGLYKIDVFTLRRISKSTNHYVPVWLPQEVDDMSMPARGLIPLPTYGSGHLTSDVPTYDVTLYQGDSYEMILDFPANILVDQYDWKASISKQPGSPTYLTNWTISPVIGDNTKLKLSVTSAQTFALPERAYWDIQAKSPSDATYQKTYMKGSVFTTRQVTQ